MNVFVQPHNGFIYLFFLELAVSFTHQEMLVPGISDSRWAKHWLQEQALSELISLDFTASWFL